MDYLIHFEDGSSGYLVHYGVLGMKWGVRNDESAARHDRDDAWDTLDEFSEGSIQDFYDTGKIPNWTTKSGMRYYDKIPDERLILGKDTVFTSYGSESKDLSGPIYTTYKDDASSTYENFGNVRYTFSPKEDFHVASMKDSYDCFADLFGSKDSSGQSFRESVYEQQLGPLGSRDKAAAYAKAAAYYPEGAAAVSYYSFVHNQYKGNECTKRFFDAMHDAGHDGILDQNDISDHTKNSPVIVLRPSESLSRHEYVQHSSIECGKRWLASVKR